MVDERGALGTVTGDLFVGLRVRSDHTGSANGYDVRIVPRHANRTVAILAISIVTTGISRRGDHHDTGAPCGLNSLIQRIDGIGFVNRTAERKIDHADVVGAL